MVVLGSLMAQGAIAQTRDTAPARLEMHAEGAREGGAMTSDLAARPLSITLGRVDVMAGFARTRLVQDGTVRQIDGATAGTDSLLAWRGALIDVGASAWLQGLRAVHLGGFVTARFPLRGSSTLSAVVSRDPIWRAARGSDPLRALRVRDLKQLDMGLTATGFRLAAALGRAKLRGPIEIEAGATFYNDGNRRAFIAGRAPIPIAATPSLEIAIEPNGYAETFSGITAGFLTPMSYARAGLGLRFRSRLGLVTLEGLANPHAFRQAGGAGIGVDGLVKSSFALGPFALALSTDFMHEGSYRFVQVGAGLTLTTPR